MSRVCWDSMLFAYWLENHPGYAPRIEQIFNSMLGRGDQLCASYFALAEVITGPLKNGDSNTVDRVEQFFDSGLVEMLPFDRRAAHEFAQLRAKHGVKPADAIHLASASSAGIDVFLTNDKNLHKLRVRGIQFIVGLNVNIF
jgi:predicted nucleic acid-binding protein